ncbi:MAG: GDYXXLXY domain-containing protein [Capsulimonadales bacterium]|nr:GDYXXLXY domain-containing protein [Capsulimonadales bacterium]
MPDEREKRGPRQLLAAILFQFAILLILIAGAARPLMIGQPVLLRVIPVDPRDVFRGEYVTLRYLGIHDRPVPTGTASASVGGEAVYVPLTPDPDGKHWTPGAPVWERPKIGRFLRGTRQTSGQVHYGIESYYLQSGTGRTYEEALRDRRLSAEIGLTSDGQGIVKRLVINP